MSARARARRGRWREHDHEHAHAHAHHDDHHVRDGALIGGGIGAAVGALGQTQDRGTVDAVGVAMGALVVGGIGAGVGAGIGYLGRPR